MAWTKSEAIAYPANQDFERLVAEKMRDLGWSCELPDTGHLTSDILCTVRDEKAVIRCAAERAGLDDVRQASAVQSYQSAALALVVHNAGAAPQVVAAAADAGIDLVHVDSLIVGSAWDRTDYGNRLRLEREISNEQQRQSREEARARQALMGYYEAVGTYERDLKAWRAARRRHPWVRGMGLVSIAPPFLLLGSDYFAVLLIASLAVAAYAFFFTAPGAEPIAPPPLEGITPQVVIPERASHVPPRPAPSAQFGRAPVPAPASLVRPGGAPAAADHPKSIVKCPKCSTKMRLPRGKRLTATCPHCKTRFRANT